jgi:hypothetical protein
MGLGSGIRKKPIPDPGSGSKGQKGTGFRIQIRNTDYNPYKERTERVFRSENVRIITVP